MSFRLLSIFLGLSLLVPSAFSATIHVPADQPTIQAGINAASPGDTVLVAPGIYTEAIDFNGKNLVLLSEFGPDSTTIARPSSEYINIRIASGEGSNAILDGFSLEGASLGPIVFIENSSPTIVRNHFVGHEGPNQDDVCLRVSVNSHPRILRNLFYDNSTCFGAIWSNTDSLEILNNDVIGGARGIIAYSPNSIIRNNIVTGCTLYGFWTNNEPMTREYNNVWGNSTNYLGGLTPDPTDISADPLYVDPGAGDYSLQETSPCIDAGHPDPQYSDPNGTRNDIGALPYVRTPVVIHVSTTGDDVNGDGSEGNPYASIRKAVGVALSGDSVLIHEGTYTGDDNIGIDLEGKAIAIRGVSAVGDVVLVPDRTTPGLEAAFVLQSGEDSLTSFSGLNFSMSGEILTAIEANAASPLIDSCFFEEPLQAHIPRHRAIVLNNSQAIVTRTNFSEFVYGCSACKTSDSTVLNALAAFESGPAINVVNSPDVRIVECQFLSNISDDGGFGGAVAFQNSKVTLSKSSFLDNAIYSSAKFSDYGGALYAQGCTLLVDSCNFANNQAPTAGGGMALVACSTVISSSTLSANVGLTGAAIYVMGGSLELSNGVLDNNSAEGTLSFDRGRGGGIAAFGTSLTIATSTFVSNNSALGYEDEPGYGCNLYLDGSATEIQQTAFLYGTGASAVEVINDTLGTTVSCSNIFGNELGDWTGALATLQDLSGNLRADPHLCFPSTTPGSVAENSPLLAANNSCGMSIGVVTEDCPAYGKSLFVDALGVDSLADGSSLNPFGTIQAAVNAAADGDTVAILPGLYTGPGNEEIDLFGKNIVILGTAGPDSTSVITTGTNFWASGIGGSTVIEGLWIEGRISGSQLVMREINGSVQFEAIGNLLMEDSELRISVSSSYEGSALIKRCNLLDTELDVGGLFVTLDSVTMQGADTGRAITAPSSYVTIANSSISGYDQLFYGNVTASNCTFKNASIAVWHSLDAPGNDLSFHACRFEQIDSLVHLSWFPSILQWDSCVFDSIGSIGLAPGTSDGPEELSFHGCTFQNSDISANLFLCVLSVTNCLFVDNTGTLAIKSAEGEPYGILGTTDINQNTVIRHDGTLLYSPYNRDASIERNIFYDCSLPVLIVGAVDSSNVTFSCNDIYPPSKDYLLDSLGVVVDTGQMHRFPLFCDPDNGDYSLAANSPCLPANNACSTLIGADTSDCDSITRIIHVSVTGDDSLGDGSESAPFATIQHGIDVSVDGDTVLVWPGTYTGEGNYNIQYFGRAIAVIGMSGADSTIIDCSSGPDGAAMGFFFGGGEDSLSSLGGFTIINGDNVYGGPNDDLLFGGGITCKIASPSLENLRIVDCATTGLLVLDCAPDTLRMRDITVSGSTTGMEVTWSNVVAKSCTFVSNGMGVFANNGILWAIDCAADSNSGVGLHCTGVQLVLDSCSFSHNGYSGADVEQSTTQAVWCSFSSNGSHGFDISDAYAGYEYNFVRALFVDNGGHGLYGSYAADDSIVVRNATFAGNGGAGIRFEHSYNRLDCSNSIFAQNSGQVLELGDSPSDLDFLSLTCCNAYGNLSGDWVGEIDSLQGLYGNLSTSPLFCDTGLHDYSLFDISPCAPENNACGTLIGALGVACNGMPEASGVVVASEDQLHVLSQMPTFAWTYFSPVAFEQDSVEIAIGTDTTWQFAEMWNPAPFAVSDTSLLYNGSPLVDGQTYYGRLRVHNSLVWSDWVSFSFRMNSVPSQPMPQSPINQAIAGALPELVLANATDPESDVLSYDFQIFQDTMLIDSSIGVIESPDSTGWTVTTPLADNTLHWWRARSFDGFEYSDWSDSGLFYVDANAQAPSVPICIYPPTPPDSVVAEQQPIFTWSTSIDPDPLDTVRYRLVTATDSAFSFQSTVDSLTDTTYTWPTDLEIAQKYWWKVQAFDKTGLNNTSEVRSFWVGVAGCCEGITGNVTADENDLVNLSDLTLLVNYLFVTFDPLPCEAEANTNGDAACGINLSDITVLVNYLFVTFDPVASCGDFSEAACGSLAK